MFKGYVLLILYPQCSRMHCRGCNLKEKPWEGCSRQGENLDENREGFLKD